MSRTILIVDDDPDFRSQLSQLIQLLKYQVLSAADGEAAWQLIERQGGSIDLVLTDLHMPKMDGFGLLARIHERCPRLPVVIVTGQGDVATSVAALRANAADFIMKPFGLPEIKATLERAEATWEQDAPSVDFRQSGACERLVLTLPTGRDTARNAARYLGEHYGRLLRGCSSQIGTIKLCLVEAIENAVVHGNLDVGSQARENDPAGYQQQIDKRLADPAYALRRVEIISEFAHGRLVLSVRDQGKGFDVDALPDLAAPELLLASGRGIFIIRNYMDEVSWSDSGTCITMVKLLDCSQVFAASPA